jgi:mannose/fructose/N-acetylgalactosamine-specific phosphotransferase system component IIC
MARPLSQRRLFVGLMTSLATLFGSALATWEIRGQSDIIADVLQISVIIAVGTAILSTVFWTLTHMKRSQAGTSPMRGLIAGVLTALFVVPLPVFASKFKHVFLDTYNGSPVHVLSAVFEALPPALFTGLQTFQVLTKASLAAVILSAALGYTIAHFSPQPSNQPAGTSPHQP